MDKQDREVMIERVVKVIRNDPTITNVQLRERGFKEGHIAVARERLGVPPPRPVSDTLLTKKDMDKAAPVGKAENLFNPWRDYEKKRGGRR